MNLSPGTASLCVDHVGGQSTLTSSMATQPLKLLAPVPRGPSVWVYASSLGGGLVAGDATSLDLRIGPGARCFFGTQASTKVFRNHCGRPCHHSTHAQVASGGLLALVPDPVQPFADADYCQRQEFHLAPGAGLVLLDWLTAGRTARGERWAFSRFRSRNEIHLGGERLLFDAVLLDPSGGALAGPHRLGRFNCLATVVLAGAPVRAAALSLLSGLALEPVLRRAPLAVSASPLRDGGALLRIAGQEVEAVADRLRRWLGFLRDILGDDPWERKW